MDSPKPERIQLRRTKGWRIPAGAVKIDRSTKWGNPFKAGERFLRSYDGISRAIYDEVRDNAHAVELFRETIEKRRWGKLNFGPSDLIRLRGRDLACWCPVGAACHGDVLIEIANRPIASAP